MPRIKFTQAYQVKGADFGNKRHDPTIDLTAEDTDSPSYAVGQVIDVSEASANHFINRKVAVRVSDGKKAALPKVVEVPAEKPEVQPEAEDYDAMTVAELHSLAADREIEGRSGLTTKADLIRAIEKDDKAKAAEKAKPVTPPAPTPPGKK